MTTATAWVGREPAPPSPAVRSQAAVSRPLLLGLTVAFLLACSVPYVSATWQAPSDERFSGILLNHFDQSYYRAAQRSTARDLPQFNRFTAEPGAPGPGPPLYPVLGHVQRVIGLPAAVVYHLPRVLAVLAVPALLAYLFGLCFPGRREPATWGVVFALFAAGAATLAPGSAVAERSGDGIPESNVLYSFSVFPHFAVSYVGVTLAFTSLAMALRGRPANRVLAAATAAGILLGLGHSFLLLPYLAVLAGFLLVAALPMVRSVRSSILPALAAAGAVVVPAAFFVSRLRDDQARLERLRGLPFPTAAPDAWWTWALGFGVVSVLAAAGAVHLIRSRRSDPLAWMLVAWAGAHALLIYLPVTVFQRRFSEAMIVPLAGLAGAGLGLVGGSDRAARGIRGALVAILAMGALSIADTLGASGEYVPAAVDDLASLVERDEIVLAGHDVSAVLPAISDATVYVARPVETLHYRAKREAVRRYAGDPTSVASLRWLRGAGITVVVVRAGDPTFQPEGLDDPARTCLVRVRNSPDLPVYRVQVGCLAAVP